MDTAEKVLPYGPVNIELFKKIRKQILREPHRLNMSEWVTPRKDEKVFSCNTAACIAGWAFVLSQDSNSPLEIINEDCFLVNPEYYGIEGVAEKVLNLDFEYHDRVFFIEYWPEPFQTQWHTAKDQEARAQVAADYISWIIGEAA